MIARVVLVLGVVLLSGGIRIAVADDGEICRRESGDIAIAACNRVISSRSSSQRHIVDAYINRGQLFYEGKDDDRALADFSRAISMNPREPQAFRNRGNCWYVKGNYDRAIADYTQ